MTSLRAFQNEIDEIQHREVHKQRAHALLEREKEKEKEVKTLKAEVKKAIPIKTSVVLSQEAQPADDEDDDLSNTEVKIQTLLLSANAADRDKARDLVAGLLTRCRGEFIFRIGARPIHARLFAGEIADGETQGFSRTQEEMNILKAGIAEIVDEVGGKTSTLYEADKPAPHAAYLLRLPPPSVMLTPEVRCAVVGNVDSGKSTTLGVLTRGALDDGRGRARVSLFRHKHEIESGRTSSVGMEILGFGPTGEPILPPSSHSTDPEALRHEKMSWEAISIEAAKIISFIDLAGHERYLKTTLYGLTSGAPSCVILIVGANAGLIGMSKEHLAIALALSVPVVVCITKIDMTPPNVLQETIKQVTRILKSPGCRKVPVFVNSTETAVEVSGVFAREKLCPIFQLSNVTGAGLDFLRKFLNLLPSSEGDTEKFVVDQPLEYCITEVWSVPYVGTVVDGIVNAGRLKVGDAILFGPDSNDEANSCMELEVARQFEGQVLILYHNTTLQRNYQVSACTAHRCLPQRLTVCGFLLLKAMLHCGAIRQTVRIIGMDHPQGILRTGDRATVTFEFISHPEFLKEGMKLLFREGKTKGLGVVTKLL
ncbi:hypothetical protein NM688_g6580 [Phlebia brevispora]|uniref:Uncharacterized protein n=1 Tax=Phlebia brevispora TaxID=194682 RepID=A0ACC1SEF9_9APHY|nr:hypothetical protein NM688_g6580 [Phlebia brevispora]